LTPVPVARAGDIPLGKMIGVETSGERLLIANAEGQFFAMRAKCNHMGGLLDKGTLEGNVVTCPLHGSKWDVRTGLLVQYARPLPPERTYAVTLKDDQILVEV
jgi:nitrite reductase/ring-hydroxylating ferredoxin subunit